MMSSTNNALDVSINQCSAYRAVEAIFNTVKLLVAREWQRVLMEPSRVIGVLVQPLLFLLVFGTGFRETFYVQGKGASYVSFFFPGIVGLVVLFSSIYATLTLVEDKKCGFFRLVLIGPGGVFAAVLGKVIATASLGFIQGLLFLALLIFLPLNISAMSLLWAIVLLLLGSLIFAFIGVLFAWLSPSSAAFHAVMSIVLVPMWLLSGAMFPLGGVMRWMGFLNPMAYFVSALRDNFMGAGPSILDVVAMIASLLLSMCLLMLAQRRRVIE